MTSRSPWRLPVATVLLAMVAMVAWGACAGESDGSGGALERALASARPVNDVGDPSALGSERWDDPVPLPELIAHRLEVELKLAMTIGDATHSLALSRSIVRDGRRFRVIERREHSEPSLAQPPSGARDLASPQAAGAAAMTPSITTSTRFEAVFDGERIAVKRGTGPFIERDARDGLPAKILAQMHDLGPSILRAFEDYLVKTPGPGRAPELADLRVQWHTLSLDRAVAPRPMPETELAALRDHDGHVFAWVAATFRPTQVSGRVGHLASSTSPPEAAIEVELSLSGGVRGGPDGGPGGFTLTLSQRVAPLRDSAIASLVERAPAEFALPADLLPPNRPRPWKMVEDVLGDDLLAPYKVER